MLGEGEGGRGVDGRGGRVAFRARGGGREAASFFRGAEEEENGVL